MGTVPPKNEFMYVCYVSSRRFHNSSKILKHAFWEKEAGKISNLAFKRLSRKNSNCLFGKKPTGKFWNLAFNLKERFQNFLKVLRYCPTKIKIALLAGSRLANFWNLLLTGSRPAKNSNCSFGGRAASKFLNFVLTGQSPSKNSNYSFGGKMARKIPFSKKGDWREKHYYG